MIPKDVDNLNQKKIQQLLAAIGTASQTPLPDDMTVTEYDWRRPRYFTRDQLCKLAAFAETIPSGCADSLSRLYQEQVDVSVASTEQCFFEPSEQSAYYIAFGTDSNKPFGILSIPCTQARIWIERALGGADQPDAAETSLSELETSLLLDVADDLLRHLAGAYGQPLKTNGEIAACEPVALDGTKEMFKMTFEVRQTAAEGDPGGFEVLLCCDKLRFITGETTPQEHAPINTASVLREYVERVPIKMTVQLGAATLSFADVLDLQAGDIVVLDNKITEPVPVQACNKTLFYGRLAKSCGQQAVVLV